MCGIIGYVGAQPCVPILLGGLRALEYRGYDSAGLAVLDGEQRLGIARVAGRLAGLEALVAEKPLPGSVGIGHTRWATHGPATQRNAHPHLAGGVAVVHNGIVENYATLRTELEGRGRRFASETDTEVLAHLIDEALGRGVPTLREATHAALARVRGSYALAVLWREQPGVLVVAKQFSPLVLGVGRDETLVASDVPALLRHTRDVVYLEDGDLAELRAGGVRIERLAVDGAAPARVERRPTRVEWSVETAERQGFEHFTLKEIHEQPTAVEATLRGRLHPGALEPDARELGLPDELARDVRRVHFVACGTSFHAALVGARWITALARLPAHAELASEFRYEEPVLDRDDLVIAVSQSGETADTLAALHEARRRGARVAAIANVVGSAIPRAAGPTLYTRAGPEIGVASTKCFTSQLAAMMMLAVWLGRRRATLDDARAGALLDGLRAVPRAMRATLETAARCRAIAHEELAPKRVQSCLFLGRGLSHPVALEGALKLKEISYVHAEGYAAGEMKHGPIALIDPRMPVVIVAPEGPYHEKTASNAQEVAARDGRLIAVVTPGEQLVRRLATASIDVPAVATELTPFVTVLPLQLLAYHAACDRGFDVDRPRNLAKTVTVE